MATEEGDIFGVTTAKAKGRDNYQYCINQQPAEVVARCSRS